jgi:hypothetical protein
MLALEGRQPGPKRIALTSFILVPRSPFGIWVYPDLTPESNAWYGIEFEEGGRHLVLSFGRPDQVQQAHPHPVLGQYAILQRPVPVGRWSYQAVDLAELYQEVGWDLPPLRPSVYRDVDADFRVVQMSLFAASDGATSPNVTEPADDAPGSWSERIYFGPVEQEALQPDPETLMAEALHDPAAYYLRLSERHVAARNYARALVALERAREFVPDDVTIGTRMAEIRGLLEARGRP